MSSNKNIYVLIAAMCMNSVSSMGAMEQLNSEVNFEFVDQFGVGGGRYEEIVFADVDPTLSCVYDDCLKIKSRRLAGMERFAQRMNFAIMPFGVRCMVSEAYGRLFGDLRIIIEGGKELLKGGLPVVNFGDPGSVEIFDEMVMLQRILLFDYCYRAYFYEFENVPGESYQEMFDRTRVGAKALLQAMQEKGEQLKKLHVSG